jgi:two-component system chemotaxis sensor kinase CheA
MLDMFIFETLELSDQLEQLILNSEKINLFETAEINEIFRIMHTIKGSAAMMFFNNISVIAHAMEDLFYYLRESEPAAMDYSKLCDLVLKGIDFIKGEIAKLESEQTADGNPEFLLDDINAYLSYLQANGSSSFASEDSSEAVAATDQGWVNESLLSLNEVSLGEKRFRAVILFEEGCEMENIRAFNVVHKLKEIAEVIQYVPTNIDDDDCILMIQQEGFKILFTTDCTRDEVESFFSNIAFVKSLEVVNLEEAKSTNSSECVREIDNFELKTEKDFNVNLKQNMISVQLNKLDQLLDLVGELVITETMVTNNPDLAEIQDLDNFNKSVRQHRKVINEIQDVVMSIRMVPLAGTFQKMNRIVRDMSKKLNKQVELEISGEETEVDKNIIEHLSDPLMHLIRNAIDHGIEPIEERIAKGKTTIGKVKLEAKNEGGDVWITIRDDGVGLNKEKILSRALEHGLISKPEAELSDQDIFSFILLPGFSTNTEITEFSGRGVGMDIVAKNIEDIGGSVYVDSTIDKGTTVSLEIPLTLAIIDGMGIRVGNSIYTVPITSIRESFKAGKDKMFTDPDGHEMIMVRGECFPILRLHELYKIQTSVHDIHDGIIMMVETDNHCLGLFADELLGEQQVVVKALPKYLKKIKGIGGCTLLGNGTSSLILDVAGLINY